MRKTEHDWSQHKLVANLPYSIASPLIIDLAWGDDRPQAMVVTLQLEVVRRLMAGPGSKDYGVLTLLTGLHYRVGEWFEIPRGSFSRSQTSTPAASSCYGATNRCCLRRNVARSSRSSSAVSPSAVRN